MRGLEFKMEKITKDFFALRISAKDSPGRIDTRPSVLSGRGDGVAGLDGARGYIHFLSASPEWNVKLYGMLSLNLSTHSTISGCSAQLFCNH